MTIQQLKKDIKSLANKDKKAIYQRFFKTGKGEYGEGDVFLGLTAPQSKEIAQKYVDSSLKDLQALLNSKIHEHRSIALGILVAQYQKADAKKKKSIFNFYMKNYNNINNWDLVDYSAYKIAGLYLLDKDKKILYDFAKSKHLWKKRIAMISCFQFIKHNEFIDTLKIARILLHDKHDLIHKAVGWMLRELGKRDQALEERYLKKYYKTMPRTMLRYAIERFEESKRQKYLKGK
jgi:3-methyladenine DNA glycosylase AlkD